VKITGRVLRAGLLSLCAVLATACSSGGSIAEPLAVPPRFVADAPVVPAELSEAYASLVAAGQGYYSRFPEQVGDASLVERRAGVYLNYTDTLQPYQDPFRINLRTYQSEEGQYSALIRKIAERIGFELENESYDSYEGIGFRTSRFELKSRRALSIGEVAWLADWIVSSYPDVFVCAKPPSYAFALADQ
jgi:hypothetical protein